MSGAREQDTPATSTSHSHGLTPTADSYTPPSSATVGASGLVESGQHSSQWQTAGLTRSSAALAPLQTRHLTTTGVQQPGLPGGARHSLLRTTSAERLMLGLTPLSQTDIAAAAGASSASTCHAGHEEPTSQIDGERRISLPSDSHITLDASPMSTDEHHHHAHHSFTSAHLATAMAPMQAHLSAPVSIHHRHVAMHMSDSCTALPAHLSAPTCTLDRILIDFLDERRRLATMGAPEVELIGPRYPDFNYLMLPPPLHKQYRAKDALSQLLTDIIVAFPDLSAQPLRVAIYYGLYLFVRWLICPTQAHFDRMIPFSRPTYTQLVMAHPVWVDLLPWPSMRDTVVRDHSRYPLDEVFVPLTGTVLIDWPYGDDAIFRNGPLEVPTSNEHLQNMPLLEIAPLFEEAMRDIKNWSIGPAFARVFPALVTSEVMVWDKPGAESS